MGSHIHTHDTRAKNSLQKFFDRLDVTQKNPNHIGVKMYNHLTYLNETLMVTESLVSFEKVLKSFLIQRSFYSVQEFFEEKPSAGWAPGHDY